LFPTNQPRHLLYGYVQAAFVDEHFDQDYNFCAVEEDPVTKKIVKRIMVNIKSKDMGLLFTSSRTCDEDPKTVAQFKDLLEKMFILDPDKRMTVSQALNHPFISGK
jgi:serine/threonine-protein kinase PRP4